MGKITNDEYWKITNCTSWVYFPSFDIQEVQDFLISIGYDIVVHETLCTVHDVTMDGGEVRRTGGTSQEMRKRILATKPGDSLPDRIDSEEADKLDMLGVFRTEIKKKLLFG